MNEAHSSNLDPPDDSGTQQARSGGAAGELETLRGELARTQAELAGARADARGLQQALNFRQRELDQLRGALGAALLALRKQLVAIERSAAWRYGHGVALRLARVRGRRPVTAGGVQAAIGQLDRILELLGAPRPADTDEQPPAAPAAPRSGRAPSAEELDELGRRLRETLGPPPEAQPWPSVAAIVVSRAPERCARLVEALAGSGYPALSAVLVDNASPDASVARVAERSWPIPVSARRLERPDSFATANNLGAERAQAELLLFVNDDIIPAEPGWLRELVAAGRDGAVAGATLVEGQIPAGGTWRVEQRGIGIGLGEELFAPLRRDAGAGVFDERLGRDEPAVAVSGACLLIGAAAFSSLGGFDSGYQFGLEDIDLCLRARARGHAIISSGRAVVVHEGSSSQLQAGREFRRINRAINHRRFRQLWGPSVRRERLDGLLRRDREWGEGPHLAIARTSNDEAGGWGDFYTALELGEAAAAAGWRVSYLATRPHRSPIPPDLDLAVVLTDRWDARDFPATTLMFAWVRNWTERWLERPWLDRYDVLLASSGRSAALLEQATGCKPVAFALATNPERFHPPAARDAERALDWVFTANRWGEQRAIEPALLARRDDRAAIYGRGWDRSKELRALDRGPIRYEQLPAAYGEAKVVLDDTAEPTLAFDAVNARVFDALACGSVVLTNCEGGVRELFDEQFPTWSRAEDVGPALDGLLRDAGRRQELAGRYRETVLARHTYRHRLDTLRELARELNAALSFCLKIGAPDREQAERWGDLYFANSFGRALRRLGHRWHVDVLSEWDSPQSSGFDVAIHVRGRSEYAPAPGQFNVLWLISHPETFDESLAEGFDLICVASESFAAELRARLSTPVRVLEQATDPRVFFPDPDPALAHELVFVGNSRGVRRKIFADLLPTDHDLAVWGGGWAEGPVAPHVQGEYVANTELRRVYSSAAIVLCDHWPDMRAAGFRSNRLYDALACGALVVSDRVAGLDQSLGDAVLTYDDSAELRALIERLLGDPGERARRTQGARERILAGETFDDRAAAFAGWVRELMRGAPPAGWRA